jgi:predicted dehydrogenase
MLGRRGRREAVAEARRVSWGIIGCGDLVERKSGSAFSRCERSRLFGVMRRSGERAADFARRHGVPFWTTDASALIHHPEVDAVYIATPPAHQLAYGLEVCAAGKPCLVEKPVGRSAGECAQLVEAFRKRDLPLFASYYRRHLPKFRRVAELLAEGRLGRVVSISYRAAAPAPKSGWRLSPELSGGGLFFDLAGHVLDLFDAWFGPLELLGGGAVNANAAHDVEDAACLTFRTPEGALGSASWNFAAARQWDALEIAGTAGRVELECMDCDSPLRLEIRRERAAGLGGSPPPLARRLSSALRRRRRRSEWLAREWRFAQTPHLYQPLVQTVVDAILDGGGAEASGAAALRASRLMDGALSDYYGGREDGFWRHPERWRSLRASAQRAARGSARPQDHALSREDLARFEEQGYLGPFRCEAPALALLRVPEEPRANAHLEDPRVLEVCSDPAIVERVAQLLGSRELSLYKTRFWSKEPGSRLNAPWHQDVGANNGGYLADGSPVPSLTVWLALDRTDAANGALRVLPGTQRQLFGDWRRNIQADLERSGALRDVDRERAVVLALEPGEFFIFHSWILHGSEANASARRRAGLNMRFVRRGHEADPAFEYVRLSAAGAEQGGGPCPTT